MRFVFLSLLVLAGCTAAQDERWRLFNEDGVQQFSRGNYRNALESFDYALTLHPNDPVLLYNAGQCYERLGEVKRAEEFYAYCLERDRKHGDARLALVGLKYRTGRMPEANQQIRDWIAQEPNSADAYVAEAWRLRQERVYPVAQTRLQEALSLEPHNRRALTEMAILYEVQGMPDRAYVLYERILLKEPDQIEISERLEQLKARGVKRPLPN